MKKTTLTDAHPDDEDIVRLIAAQSVNVPDQLRHSILEQAALECEQDNNASKITPHQPVHEHTSATRGWTRGFAIAATFLIAAIVTPMILKSPESALDGNNTKSLTRADANNSQPAVSALQAAAPEDMAQTADLVSEQSDIVAMESDELTISSRLSQSYESSGVASSMKAAKSFQAEEIETSPPQLSPSPMTRQNTFNSAPSLSYRESADKWMNEIKVLVANGDTQKARNEYHLFEQRYPAEAKRFKPDFDGQPIEDASPVEHRNLEQ